MKINHHTTYCSIKNQLLRDYVRIGSNLCKEMNVFASEKQSNSRQKLQWAKLCWNWEWLCTSGEIYGLFLNSTSVFFFHIFQDKNEDVILSSTPPRQEDVNTFLCLSVLCSRCLNSSEHWRPSRRQGNVIVSTPGCQYRFHSSAPQGPLPFT